MEFLCSHQEREASSRIEADSRSGRIRQQFAIDERFGNLHRI